jgi:hypothetical protein
MTAPITAAMVRERFPNPISLNAPEAHKPGCYCVGGAFLAVLDETATPGYPDIPFPEPEVIAEGLRRANPSLTVDRSNRYAWNIINDNDAEDFDDAWKDLDAAMTYGREATS